MVSKIFERVVFKCVFKYFHENFILTIYQSAFLPGRSTVTQLLEVYHQFCQAADSNKEIRVVFLDISKAFDKVWHKSIIYKLKKCELGGNLLDWFSNYLKERLQRVVINSQASGRGTVEARSTAGFSIGLTAHCCVALPHKTFCG